jgi:hypothetical protein
MQSNALEQARLQAIQAGEAAQAEGRAMRAVSARLHLQDEGFLRNSHRMVEGAVVMLIGVTMTTLALYNLALWLTS